MNRISLIATGLALLLLAAPVAAEQKPTASKSPADVAAPPAKPAAPPKKAAEPQKPAAAADLAAVRATSAAFAEAFNKRDAKAVAALWTEDGDYVDDAGRTYTGRAEIAKVYAAYFAENPHARIRIVVDSLRLLSSDAAIEDGRTFVDPPPAGAPAIGRYTVVHVEVGGRWLMSTVRDTCIETPSAYRHVADLEFLIGAWKAEEAGGTSESTCRWVANKSYVERCYKVTRADGTSLSGVQIIGWNPAAGRMQSWNFSSDGGHAVGAWTPTSGGWSAEVRGVTGDGVPTAAVNRLTRLDDNAYVWQSTNRTVGGAALPDTDEVVIKRVPTAR